MIYLLGIRLTMHLAAQQTFSLETYSLGLRSKNLLKFLRLFNGNSEVSVSLRVRGLVVWKFADPQTGFPCQKKVFCCVNK